MRSDLNPEQLQAVEHDGGPLLVLAGAGSGKTRVLTARVVRLIQAGGVPPHRLLAVTFTNKAAGEMRERIGRQLGRDTRGLWIGTFHSIAARLLRNEADRTRRGRAFSIYDEEDALRAIRAAMEEVGLDLQRWSPGAIRSRISGAKSALQAPSAYVAGAFDLLSKAVAEVYPVYDRLLERRNAYDFDDLLFHAVRLLEGDAEVRSRYATRFLHVLVDEYQDTNHAQYRMIRALAREHGNVCVVGDDDQSIYGWRGADLRNILDFERDFGGATVVRLERNYRSTARILEVANAVISHNHRRKPKRLRTTRPPGEAVLVVHAADEKREAMWTARELRSFAGVHRVGDCAILYRTNAQSRAYEEALRQAGLPYRIVGGVPFYARREIKDVLAYLRLIVNPLDDAAFERAIAWPRRGVGRVTLERLRAARTPGGGLLQVAARAEEVDEVPVSGAKALARFAASLEELRELQSDAPVRSVLEECIRIFGLASALEEEEGGAERLENLAELISTAAAFDPAEVEEAVEGSSELELYLQSVSLRAEIDDVELGEDAVTLMTVHNAKGLEFPFVFLGGLEEGLFPLSRALEDNGDVEEERRLFYVGVTRARERLYLTYADRRWRAGFARSSAPSSFLDELPEESVCRKFAGGPGRRSRGDVGRTGREPWRGGSEWKRRSTEDDSGGRSGRANEFEWRREPGARRRVTGGEEERIRGRSGPERESPVPSGPRYDYGDSQVPLTLEPGSHVVHPRFGPGRIVSLSGGGVRTKAEIEFESVGTKKVMVAYAGLRPA
ncbi:MAG: ATP-dependent helicase [Gemmatimonadota bacterium]